MRAKVTRKYGNDTYPKVGQVSLGRAGATLVKGRRSGNLRAPSSGNQGPPPQFIRQISQFISSRKYISDDKPDPCLNFHNPPEGKGISVGRDVQVRIPTFRPLPVRPREQVDP